MSVRCFLHFRYGRDDNTLAWVAQDEAAALKIGTPSSAPMDASEWMRIYFRHARQVHRVAAQLLDEFPATRASLYRQFQNLRSRLSNSEFAVVDGRIFLQRPESLGDPGLPLRMFRFMARHGLALSSTTEHQMEEVLGPWRPIRPRARSSGTTCRKFCWRRTRPMLCGPCTRSDCLRSLLPELKGIDALVIRDYSHRLRWTSTPLWPSKIFTSCRQSHSSWDQRYAELLDELEQPDLLYLALLLHDTGKALKTDSHVTGSVELAKTCLDRLDLDDPDRETVLVPDRPPYGIERRPAPGHFRSRARSTNSRKRWKRRSA